MRGAIEIDKHTGNVIESTLQSENSQKIADCVTSMLQDVAVYMRMSGAQNLQHVAVKLDSHHCVQILMAGPDKIKALVQEITPIK